MYDELIKRLRDNGNFFVKYIPNAEGEVLFQAADAIEELSKSKWIMIESRPMDDKERRYYDEHYGYNLTDDEAVIYCCQLPEDGQEVLVCSKYGHVWLDTFEDDPDYGVGFETNGDMDGLVAWIPKPKPPKEDV